jgi:hypothetical protein
MTEEKILERLKIYMEAFHNKNFDTLIEILYQDEVHELRKNLEWAARAFEPFGETKGFLSFFENVKNADDLAKLTDKEFVSSFISKMVGEMPASKVAELAKTVLIEGIDHVDYIANVRYSFINVFSKERERVASEAQMILSEGEWYVLFKPGMEDALERFKSQINTFNEAKAQDNLKIAEQTPPDEMEKFALYGFKTYADDVVITPRFRDAREFSNGLASVKIFTKWGYIDKMGEIVITPNYDLAEDFMDNYAMVAVRNPQNMIDKNWGLIDKSGEVILPTKYQAIKDLNEGFFAVMQNGLWAFANEDGEIITDFKYLKVHDFEGGKAQAIFNYNDDQWTVYINELGQEIGEVEQDDVKIFYLNDKYEDDDDDDFDDDDYDEDEKGFEYDEKFEDDDEDYGDDDDFDGEEYDYDADDFDDDDFDDDDDDDYEDDDF